MNGRHAGLLALLALSGCGPAGSEPAEGTARSLRVAVSQHFTNAPLFIAQEEGYFTEEGLEVDLQEPPGQSTSQIVPVLARGGVDAIAGALSVGMLNAMARDVPIRFVAEKGHYGRAATCSYSGIVGRRQLQERGEVSGAADLKGRRLARGTSLATDYVFETLLDSLDLRAEDVRRTTIPLPSLLEALENGAVDFASAVEPWLTHLQEAGHEIVVSSERIVPDLPFAILAFGPTLIEGDPDAGRRFVRAYLRGVRQYNEGKTARNLEILSRATRMDRGTLERICWPSIREDGRIDVGSVLLMQEWARRKGWMEQIVPASGFYDSSFLEAAAAAGESP